nr:TolC family protein [Planctomycetota bacterium]
MRRLIQKSKRIYLFAVVGFAWLLVAPGGCTGTKPRTVTPSFALPPEFSTQGVEEMPQEWWRSLDDVQLNAVVEEALAHNFTIRSAWARLTQAEQTAIKTGAGLYPSATYQAGVERLGRRTSDNTTYTSNYSAGLVAAYEVDLWGRIGSARNAAVLDAEAAQENVNAAAMTLTAAVGKTWYQLAEAKQQEQIITQQIRTNEKILEVIKLQFRQAQVGAADVFSQQQLIQSSRGRLIQTQENIALLQHQLSILMGKTPGPWWSDRSIDLVTLGQLPKIDVPAVVIQRRPDVMSAYRVVQAADQRLASAIADQYPAISLSAGIETSAARTRDLFDDWLANLAANLTGPMFDAGLRKAEARRTRAGLSGKLQDYRQSVLERLQETEDADRPGNHQPPS